MRMFNADGTESAMCGNGLRCVAKYVVDHGLITPDNGGLVLVQTGAGVVQATCRWGVDAADGVESVIVDMGRPVIDPEAVGVRRDQLGGGDGPTFEIESSGGRFEAVFVSMGNPHAVIHVEDVQRIDLAVIGPSIEGHRAFPQRMNAHFVEVIDPNEVVMRTWERGSGLTGACGSGACAVCVAGVLAGRTGRSLLAHLPGGDLQLEWSDATDHVLMTGPAVEVFTGRWPAACDV
jgi:diaminopimelate epimerase